MERILIKELRNYDDKIVMVSGWVHRIRKLGKLAFIIIRDRTGIVQCVIDTKTIDIKSLKLESVVGITGVVQKKTGIGEDVELWTHSLVIYSEVKQDLPIEINKENLEANIDTILNNRVLALRNLKANAIFKVQAVLAQALKTNVCHACRRKLNS